MLDPSQSNLGDRIYTTLTRAMDSLYKQRNFCVEVSSYHVGFVVRNPVRGVFDKVMVEDFNSATRTS